MAHNPPIFLPGTIPAHHVISPSELDKLDQCQSEAIDISSGGSYAPEKPIAIGGAGLALQQTSLVTGKVSTGRASSGLSLRASIHPTFSAARTRKVVIPLMAVSDYAIEGQRTFELASDPDGLRSIAASQTRWAFHIPPFLLHNGATLTFARLRWRPRAAPTSISNVNEVPWFRFFRVKKDGSNATDLTPTNLLEHFTLTPRANSTAYSVGAYVRTTAQAGWGGSNGFSYRCIVAGTSASVESSPGVTIGSLWGDGTVTWRIEYGYANPYNHYRFPAIDSTEPETFFNGGLVQEIAHPMTLNTTIDTDTYFYSVEIVDPGKYGNLYHSIVLDIGNLQSLKEP